MGLYKDWCDATKEKDKRRRYWTYVEKDGGREAVSEGLVETVRSHYDRLENIAEDVKRLGYEAAAVILKAELPQTPTARSGDLGEILATELVEEEIGLRVPVRRMRYKDGRNMAMRGDDFIGAGYSGDHLWLLKGEAKSNQRLGRGVVVEARRVTKYSDTDVFRVVEALGRQSGATLGDVIQNIGSRAEGLAKLKAMMVGRIVRLDLTEQIGDATPVGLVSSEES